MQKISTFSILLFCASILSAQDPCTSINYHAFKAESVSGTYTDLGTQGTKINVSSLDDGNSEPQEIGFYFDYQCQTFSQFIFNTNGFIKLGTETTPKNNLFFSNAQSTNGGVFNNPDSNNVNLIVPFNHDIETIAAEPDFRVHASGAAPYRVCTVQWKNMQEWSSDPATKQYIDMDFQLKLYETTNVIEFVYGDWIPSTNTSNYKTGACGLKGKSNADDQLLVVVKSSASHWENVYFHNGNYASNESFNFGGPPDRPKPDPGRTYRFTPTYNKDLSVREIYTLADASSYYSSPQTISANIMNAGFTPQSEIPVILEIWGANSFIDTQYISHLAFGQCARINFAGFSPTSNGLNLMQVYVGNDDAMDNNLIQHAQRINDFNLNYAANNAEDGAYGFQSGVQGIYFVKYPVHGTASVVSVNAFIAHDSNSIDKAVFAAILDANGLLVARSDNHQIQQSDLGGWHSFSFTNALVFKDEDFYAGLGMTSSLTEYSPLGVQEENPVRPDTYFKSLITGSGLQPMDTTSFTSRFMIGVTLIGTQPFAGPATGDTTICAYGKANITLQEFTGFITWQRSLDGINDWQAVLEAPGSNSGNYLTPPLTTSTYYRAAVFQPGFGVAYSNSVFVEVIPSTPVITSFGDVLESTATIGNQWYDQNGLIPGATDQFYIALIPGTYFVVVTTDECISAPSNQIELLTVSSRDIQELEGIKLYPNPVGDMLTIEMEENKEEVHFEIINALGMVVNHGLLQGRNRIEMRELTTGIYVIHFYTDEHQLLKKLIKK